jgi:hypothetical protein
MTNQKLFKTLKPHDFLGINLFRTKWPSARYFTIKQKDKFMSLKLNNLLETHWSSHDRTVVNLVLLLEVVLQKGCNLQQIKTRGFNRSNESILMGECKL